MQNMQGRKQIKTRYLWLTFVVTLALGVLLILWSTRAENNTFPLILMVIDFIIMTMCINTAISRTFRYKPKKRKYLVKKYQGPTSKELDSSLVKQGFIRKGVRFGHGYMKIEGTTAYKIVAIDEPDKYFVSADTIASETKEETATPGLEDCTKFIGFEIFFTATETVKEKITDFAFQGKNIYYDGLYFDNDENLFIEANHVKPNDEYQKEYERMLEFIGFTEEIKEELE